MSDQATFFAESDWTAGVVGLGYVGLPLLMASVAQGLRAVGFDTSEEVVDRLRRGVSHVDDVSDSSLTEALDRASFTHDPSDLSQAHAIFICVPSPLGRNREPNLAYIEAAAGTIADVGRPGQLIVLESTTYPGTTEDLLVPAVEKAGLTLDEDVWVAYSPERVSPGGALKTSQIPKVVGGITAESGLVAAAAYRRLVPEVRLVSTARAAEMSKLLENTYRAVNIGLINEIAQLSHGLDIDIWEVIDAAATKPFGFQAFYPGPGVGGHCIPLDPQYLAWKARGANLSTRFIETAEQVNSHMPDYVVSRVGESLNAAGRAINGSRLLVVGLAYKPDVSDDRESASLEVARKLKARGGDVHVFDPLIGPERILAHGFEFEDSPDSGAGYDMAVILTDHSGAPYREIARAATRVFDTRGVYRRLGIVLDNVEAL
ncbi:MAG TPA: nucleotide sugar dehydrogenase [Acidimicrobiia bacterium]|nr:nucleotide sugar dehydrogenase [Acidimicrobiia bacterium]